jgi:hypothetical protein
MTQRIMKSYLFAGIGIVISIWAIGSVARADNGLAAPNRVARAEALARMRVTQSSPSETPFFMSGLNQLKEQGIDVGPLCIQLSGGCMTRGQLAYRESEYYSVGGLREMPKAGLYTSLIEARFPTRYAHEQFAGVARRNGVDELALLQAVEFQERLQHAYVRAFAAKHPNRPATEIQGIRYSYEWAVMDNGEIAEIGRAVGDGD